MVKTLDLWIIACTIRSKLYAFQVASSKIHKFSTMSKDLTNDNAQRPGETALPFDPASPPHDAGVKFIGHIETPWKTRRDCPRNSSSHYNGEVEGDCILHLNSSYRQGLCGLEGNFSHAIVLYWMNEARRDLIVQSPSHLNGGSRGVFSLRSPVRPNPIALSVVKLLNIDVEEGQLKVLGLDCIDGTPIVDVKPYVVTLDARNDSRGQCCPEGAK